MSLLALLQGLQAFPYRLSLLLPEHGAMVDRAQELGVSVHILPMHALMVERQWRAALRDGVQALWEISGYRQFFQEFSIDLVHINSYRVGIPVTVAARLVGIPVVWHLRVIPQSRWKRRLVAGLSHFPDRLVAISQAVVQEMRLEGRSNVRQVYNAVDMAPFVQGNSGQLRQKLCQELGLPRASTLVCSVGHLIPWKGHDRLLHAFARLPPDPQRYLLIVGGQITAVWSNLDRQQSYRQYLQQLATELGVADKVIFTGFREDVPQILQAIDLFVQASTVQEAFGRVVVEALAAGKRVVAPNAGGIPEIVANDGQVGFLFAPNDVEDLIRQLQAALAADEEPARRAAQQIQSQFTVDRHAAAMNAIYEEILPV